MAQGNHHSTKERKDDSLASGEARMCRCIRDAVNISTGQVYQTGTALARELKQKTPDGCGRVHLEEKNPITHDLACLAGTWDVFQELAPLDLNVDEWNLIMLSAVVGDNIRLYEYAISQGATKTAMSHEWASLYLPTCFWHSQEIPPPSPEEAGGVGIIFAIFVSNSAALPWLRRVHPMELSTLRYKWSSQRRPSRNSAYRQVKHSWNMFELLFHCRGEVNLPHTSAERTDFVETAQYLLEECNVPNQYDVSIFSTFCSNILSRAWGGYMAFL